MNSPGERRWRRGWTVVLGGLVVCAAACSDTNNNAAIVDAGSDAADVRLREPGYLWFAGSVLSAFTKSETKMSHDHGPGFVLVPTVPVRNFHDLAFDRDGNLWTVPLAGDQIMRMPAAGLRNAIPPTPDVVATGPALKNPQSLVFDAAGSLWVLNFSGAGVAVGSIVRFDNPGALSGTTMVTPAATIVPGADKAAIARFAQPTAIALDPAGNLWLAAANNVLRIDDPAALHGQVTAAPSAVISASDSSYASLAFDTGGALWITGAKTGFFAARFADPSVLKGAVTAAPAATVHLTAKDALFAGGMAFDADGAMWVAMSNQLIKLSGAAGLTGDVTPTPDVVLGLYSYPDLSSKLLLTP